MPNPYNAPEISVQDLARRLADGEAFVLLDVRESYELDAASLPPEYVTPVPLSQLAEQQLAALPPAAREQDTPIAVLCHHGIRSAQVTLWLRQQGWTNVVSVDGGIDAYAREIDSTVGSY
jgi:rhodanese-related sulfurtransferase